MITSCARGLVDLAPDAQGFVEHDLEHLDVGPVGELRHGGMHQAGQGAVAEDAQTGLAGEGPAVHAGPSEEIQGSESAEHCNMALRCQRRCKYRSTVLVLQGTPLDVAPTG
jgi:hypothetical protein